MKRRINFVQSQTVHIMLRYHMYKYDNFCGIEYGYFYLEIVLSNKANIMCDGPHGRWESSTT
jgi:hypothetical protein